MPPEPVTNLCPYCHRAMQVTRMSCPSCEISIAADFPAPRLARLPMEHQRFIEMFVLASGNLKSIAEQAGVSYPTVRSRLDRIIDTLQRVVAESCDASEESFGDKERTEAAARLIKAI
ncbi:MAG TPA: DUF2089 family protein [Thermoanaerobaculia bacterium]|jgi:hypothetical protein|nr:DUF2089 family protein [Thermoanaerobaculia bacterium]